MRRRPGEWVCSPNVPGMGDTRWQPMPLLKNGSIFLLQGRSLWGLRRRVRRGTVIMPEEDEIFYYDRYGGRTETEKVYGERWLRWTYETLPGRLLLATLIRRGFFSRFYGWRMDRPSSRGKIGPFIRRYGVDENEFAEPARSFRSFNAFFCRKLKPESRPVAEGEGIAVFPADGRHLVFPDLDRVDRVYAKGQGFSLDGLLGDRELAKGYAGGAMSISRLCPVDYHRFHFPCAGRPGPASEIPGDLYSVNPLALRRRLSILWRNRRFLTRLETVAWGTVLCLEIGATCVGSVVQTYSPDRQVLKGEEKGFFRFGGSCVILLFQRDRIEFDEDLVSHTQEGMETYARMGDRLGTASGAERGQR